MSKAAEANFRPRTNDFVSAILGYETKVKFYIFITNFLKAITVTYTPTGNLADYVNTSGDSLLTQKHVAFEIITIRSDYGVRVIEEDFSFLICISHGQGLRGGVHLIYEGNEGAIFGGGLNCDRPLLVNVHDGVGTITFLPLFRAGDANIIGRFFLEPD